MDGKVIEKIEDATRCAIEGPFGAAVEARWVDPAPADASGVKARKVGYVRNVDLTALRRLARPHGLTVWVLAASGAFMHEERPLARVRTSVPLPAKLKARGRGASDVSGSRTFDQDPRFGFVVLGEIASRALSPAVDDPGPAIDVIGTAVRLLTIWRTRLAVVREPVDAAVRLEPIDYAGLLDDVLRPVATDGASSVSVVLRLQKAFAALYAEAGEAPGPVTRAARRLA